MKTKKMPIYIPYVPHGGVEVNHMLITALERGALAFCPSRRFIFSFWQHPSSSRPKHPNVWNIVAVCGVNCFERTVKGRFAAKGYTMGY